MRFELLRELDDGQRVFVSAQGSRIEAERQAQELGEFWPGIYVIREAPFPPQSCAAAPQQDIRDSRP